MEKTNVYIKLLNVPSNMVEYYDTDAVVVELEGLVPKEYSEYCKQCENT